MLVRFTLPCRAFTNATWLVPVPPSTARPFLNACRLSRSSPAPRLTVFRFVLFRLATVLPSNVPALNTFRLLVAVSFVKFRSDLPVTLIVAASPTLVIPVVAPSRS